MTDGGTCEYTLDPDVPDTWGASDDSKCYVSSRALNDDGVWACPHDAEEGEDLCLFHLPVEQKQDRRVTAALLDTLDSLDSGVTEPPCRTQFIGARFGDLKIAGESLELPADHAIDLTHCRFRADVSLVDSQFDAEINLTGATIEQGFRAVGTRFGRSVKFNYASFEGRVLFDDVRFDDRVYFKLITASAPVEFANTALNGWFSFRDAVFEGPVRISESAFEAREISGTFQGATFEQEATFERTLIAGDFGFTTATFQSGLTFGEMRTISALDFHGTVITGDLVCDGTEFEGTVDFRSPSRYPNTRIEGEGSFEDARFVGKPEFIGTEFGEASFDDVTFEKGATFQEVQFDGKASFSGMASKARGKFEFVDVTVGGPGEFDDAYFAKSVDLSNTEFRADATFREAQFHKSNSLDRFDASDATFGGRVSFVEASFYLPARFTDVQVAGTAQFSGVRFDSKSDFSGARFGSDVCFTDAVFGYSTDWSGAIVGGDADFSGVDWDATNALGEPVSHTLTGMTVRGDADFSSLSRDDAGNFSEIDVSGKLIRDK